MKPLFKAGESDFLDLLCLGLRTNWLIVGIEMSSSLHFLIPHIQVVHF